MGDIRALGCFTIDTTDLDRWRTFAHDVLDLGVVAGGNDDTPHLRLDERARRITLCHGDIEYGYDGLTVEEGQYLPQLLASDSYWGHDWSGSEPLACTIPLDETVADALAGSLSELAVESV